MDDDRLRRPSLPAFRLADLTASAFMARLQAHIAELSATLAAGQHVAAYALLPSGNSMRVESVGWHDPTLVTLYGRDAKTNEEARLLTHVHGVQVQVAIESVPANATPRRIGFRDESQ
jgi:hypothetical protein